MTLVLWLSDEADDDAGDLPCLLEPTTPAMIAPTTNTQPVTAKATRFRLLLPLLLLLPTAPAMAVAAAPVVGVGAGGMAIGRGDLC